MPSPGSSGSGGGFAALPPDRPVLDRRDDLVDVFCRRGPEPHLVTNYLVQLLRGHFAERDGIGDPDLGDLLWAPDPASPIRIVSWEEWDPELAGHRPMLVVADEDWQFDHEGLGQRTMDDRQIRVQRVHGAHSVFLLCATPGEVPLLRNEVERLLFAFGPQIAGDMRMDRFLVARGTAAAPLGIAEEHAAAVAVTYTFERSVEVVGRFPVLKHLRFSPGPAGDQDPS